MEATGLLGEDEHGFSTFEDLQRILEAAQRKKLHTHQIYALLCNYWCFHLNPHPLDSLEGINICFFDRGLFPIFNIDGSRWESKSHSDLKVRDIYRVRVRYSRNLVDRNMARRFYWLIDENKSKVNNIVMVHYLREEISGPLEGFTSRNPDWTPHDFNTRDEFVHQNDSNNSTAPIGGEALVYNQSDRTAVCGGPYYDARRITQEGSGANHNGMEEIAGSGRNVQNGGLALDDQGFIVWNGPRPHPIYSNTSAAPTEDESSVDYQPNQIAACGSYYDGMGAYPPWDPINVDGNDLSGAPVNGGRTGWFEDQVQMPTTSLVGECLGSGTNVQNLDPILDHNDLSLLNKILFLPIHSNNSTVPTGGEVLVDNQKSDSSTWFL